MGVLFPTEALIGFGQKRIASTRPNIKTRAIGWLPVLRSSSWPCPSP